VSRVGHSIVRVLFTEESTEEILFEEILLIKEILMLDFTPALFHFLVR